jgi:hypothetical protein
MSASPARICTHRSRQNCGVTSVATAVSGLLNTPALLLASKRNWYFPAPRFGIHGLSHRDRLSPSVIERIEAMP